jgi:hypothetical protein
MSVENANNVVQMSEVTGVTPKKVNENPDPFDVMDCREDVIDALRLWGHDGGRFNTTGTLGNTIYFDYNTEEHSQRIWSRTGHGGQCMEMAMKVQTVDDHEQMVAVWDMHVIAESKEQFIEMYSKWYDMYKAPQMEARKNGGGDDAVANS